MVHAAKRSCRKRVYGTEMDPKDMCCTCKSLARLSDSALKSKYGKAANVPCDKLSSSGSVHEADPPPSPASTLTRGSREEVARPSLSEKALAFRSGPDAFGYSAAPANGAKLHLERNTFPPPKKSTTATKRQALATIAGKPVAVSNGGTSTSAMNKARASAGAVTHGVANALAPKNERQGLEMIRDAAQKRLSEIEAEEADKSAAAASSSHSSPSSSSSDDQRDEQQPTSPCRGNCRDSRCSSPFASVLGGSMSKKGDGTDGVSTDDGGTNGSSSSAAAGGGGGGGGGGGDTSSTDGGESCTDSSSMEIDDGGDSDSSDRRAPKAPAHLGLDEPPARLSREDKQDWRIFKEMNQEMADWMVNQRPNVRRPILAAFVQSHTKRAVERRLGQDINDEEWNEAVHYAHYPGPFQPTPVQLEETLRCKIPQELITKLCLVLEGRDNTQRYAYGRKLIALCGGSTTLELDNVDRMKKAREITAEYIIQIDSEVMEGLTDLPCDEERCTCIEQDTLRRCMLGRGHKKDGSSARCKFTPKGSIGRTAVLALVECLTGDDIKALSGLDDTRMVKGRENFIHIRRLITELCDPNLQGASDEAERELLRQKKAELEKKVDETELFYKTDFYTHVEQDGEYECCCLDCGFFDADGRETFECANASEHKRSCNKCTMGYDVIIQLKKLQKNAAEMQGRDIKERQQLDQKAQELVECQANLDEYRSHLARQISEDAFDREEIRKLADDTIRVTSDWKHKILECYFRENMQKYFGKKGTSMLGFMLMWNSTDPEERAKGIKEVKFVMLLTDDSLQDEWSVACAKMEVYREHVPEHIKKSIFVADGASCFSSVLHRAIQPMWKEWTGVEEIVFRITVAGSGKSALDGMFGRFSGVTTTAVNAGMEYRDAGGILRATEYAGAGLTATIVGIFSPDRESGRLYARVVGDISLESVLRTELLPCGGWMAHTHSGRGGFRISRNDIALFDKKPPQNPSNAWVADNNLLLDADDDFYWTEHILEYLDNSAEYLDLDEETDRLKNKEVKGVDDEQQIQRNERRLVELDEEAEEYEQCKVGLMQVWPRVARSCVLSIIPEPRLKEDTVYGENRKGHLRTTSSSANETESRGQVRQRKRQSRVEAAVQKKEEAILQRRRAQENAGLLLCDARCPHTNRFCRKQYLPNQRHHLEKHKERGEHDFPVGMQAKDKAALVLSRPGGVLAGGSRPDRLNRSADPNVVEEPEEKESTIAARCRGKFNRKGRIAPYNKPEKLKAMLIEIFGRRPVATPQQAYAELRDMIDPVDNGLMFCWSKRGEVGLVPKSDKERWEAWDGCSICGLKPCTGCNGKLPTVAEIKSYFSYLAQQRKRESSNDGGDEGPKNKRRRQK